MYHLKVEWQARSLKEQPLFDLLVGKYAPKSVIDLGCGDGGHSRHYTAKSIDYFGVDMSPKMIRSARKLNPIIAPRKFVVGDLTNRATLPDRAFDQVILLGNTLPHLLTATQLQKCARNVARLLNPGGYFAVQTVNPGKLEGKSIHLLPQKLAGNVLFVPVYIRAGQIWKFDMNIFTFNRSRSTAPRVLTTCLRFWSNKQIELFMKKQGLSLVDKFGDSQLNEYQEQTSENMILVFRKAGDA